MKSINIAAINPLFMFALFGRAAACVVLAIAKPNSPEGARFWASYLTNWTFWDRVRTVTLLAAATVLMMALY